MFLVAVAGEGERVIGMAHWSRIGGREENWRAGWGLRWWDPSKYLATTCFAL